MDQPRTHSRTTTTTTSNTQPTTNTSSSSSSSSNKMNKSERRSVSLQSNTKESDLSSLTGISSDSNNTNNNSSNSNNNDDDDDDINMEMDLDMDMDMDMDMNMDMNMDMAINSTMRVNVNIPIHMNMDIQDSSTEHTPQSNPLLQNEQDLDVYTESPSEINTSRGNDLIIPSMQINNNTISNNEKIKSSSQITSPNKSIDDVNNLQSTLFKAFDSKTGRFLSNTSDNKQITHTSSSLNLNTNSNSNSNSNSIPTTSSTSNNNNITSLASTTISNSSASSTSSASSSSSSSLLSNNKNRKVKMESVPPEDINHTISWTSAAPSPPMLPVLEEQQFLPTNTSNDETINTITNTISSSSSSSANNLLTSNTTIRDIHSKSIQSKNLLSNMLMLTNSTNKQKPYSNLNDDTISNINKSNSRLTPFSITTNNDYNINTNSIDNTTFLKVYSKNNKSRSYSVPTILHSSLKRLASHNGQYYRNTRPHLSVGPQNHLSSSSTTATTTTASSSSSSASSSVSSSGVKKKQFTRTHPYLFSTLARISSNSCNSIRPLSTLSKGLIDNNLNTVPHNLESTLNSTNNTDTNIINNNDDHNNNVLKRVVYLGQRNNDNINISTPKKSSESSLENRINAIKLTPNPVPYPPINLQGLKEIDLQEILKNPQLRHDIIFDPLLQFRPNLDGVRGVKKRQLADKYWQNIQNEIYVYSKRPNVFDYNKTRLGPLFDTLREVLLTIVPQKEASMITDILDTELNVRGLVKGSLVLTNLSGWLSDLFKHHCAPMRDPWVDKMSNKFKEAEEQNSLSKLIEGLRLVLQILETMKLDIANHQIRILRPALLNNAVEFEKQYFNFLMSSKRVDLKLSLVWFDKKFDEYTKLKSDIPKETTVPDVYRICIRSVISLLSCKKIFREYPTALYFDYSRLILLRADIRQIVCLIVCQLLFQQLVGNDSMEKKVKDYITSHYTNKRLKNEIISIITDDHGNCRWTNNTMSIAVHLCKVINDLKEEYHNKKTGSTTTKEIRNVCFHL